METTEMPEITDDKYKEYVAEIKAKFSCGEKNHLNFLMRNTFKARRKWMSSIPDAAVAVIVEEFPLFQDELVVRFLCFISTVV